MLARQEEVCPEVCDVRLQETGKIRGLQGLKLMMELRMLYKPSLGSCRTVQGFGVVGGLSQEPG